MGTNYTVKFAGAACPTNARIDFTAVCRLCQTSIPIGSLVSFTNVVLVKPASSSLKAS